MAIEASLVMRAAGYSAAAALVSLILSGITIALFFGGAGSVFGPLNDLFTALALGFLVLPVVALWMLVRDDAGAWFGIVSLLALVGIAVGAGGQVLLVLGAIPLETSFVTGGIGIVPVLAWAAALAWESFRSPALSDLVGWTTAVALGLAALTAVGSALTTGVGLWILSGALLVALSGWLVSLSSDLLARA